jgi:hypothetical protein
MYIVTLLVRRSLANDLKGFDETLPVGEDTDFLFRLAFRTHFCFVSQKLVDIDRTPSRGVGLMELFYEQSDRMYAARQYMFSKWLSLPQLTEPLRNEIQGHMRELLYDWTVRKIYQRSYPEALRHVREIRDVGESYSAILMRLVHRGLRRIRYRFGRDVSSNNVAGIDHGYEIGKRPS